VEFHENDIEFHEVSYKRFKGSEVQGSEVQGFRGSRVQRFWGSEVQRFESLF
jgi:hypothetical protein